ncbi:hypothetical protein [Sphaerisporangium fuscum]|uniref:hypothetical protein n=1 Tax=Sphaerisporangium fuscum TaxID=2835868 RepID=UPI001BDC2CD3|nr:hypothetical protein [Sphaerisporangium fuscum]
MSLMRSTTLAVCALAFGGTLATGTAAYADQGPAGKPPAVRAAQLVAAGSTVPGVGWEPYKDNGLSIHVDTSSAHFSGTPVYTISVGGTGRQWVLSGTNTIYNAGPAGFDVYLRWVDNGPLKPAMAMIDKWYVNWIGVGSS